MTATYLTHASEIYTKQGPTGECAEVLAGEVQDYGGNLIFAGSADDCVKARAKYRLPSRLVPTEYRRVGEVAGADHAWQLVVID